MKMTNEMTNEMTKKRNNKGFSLVELIVVIAIMVVLVAVLAPVFTKYVEQSRRATDIQNANTIAQAVLVEVADGNLTSSSAVADSANISSIKTTPVTKGDAVSKGATFTYVYNATTNTCQVYVTGDNTTDLSSDAGATSYKNT